MLPRPQLDLRGVGDIDAASAEWGANCGPAALAGALGLQISDVFQAVSERPQADRQLELVAVEPEPPKFRGYMNVRHMIDALEHLGAKFGRRWKNPGTAVLDAVNGGTLLIRIQWGGPWTRDPRAALTHSHWIAYKHGYFGPRTHYARVSGGEQEPGWILDVNNLSNSWVPRWMWEKTVVPLLLPERGDGTWSLSWVGEVLR